MTLRLWPKGGLPGLLHHFTDRLVAFEYNNVPKNHALIFVGGLSDGIGTTAYVAELVHSLRDTNWSIFQPTLTSSYHGWGTSSLDQDVEELAVLVSYLRQLKGEDSKIVLMGHSTGSQDVLHYLYQSSAVAERPPVEGAILQAPVSDRQAIHSIMKTGFCGKTGEEVTAVYKELVSLSQAAAAKGEAADTLLPLPLTAQIYPGTALSAERWLSLASPNSPQHPGVDDMFSSDLTDDLLGQTFGQVNGRGLLKGQLMVLMSGADASVPAWIDKKEVLRRWQTATDAVGAKIWYPGSGIVEGANHALDENDQIEPRKDLAIRVGQFLESVALL